MRFLVDEKFKSGSTSQLKKLLKTLPPEITILDLTGNDLGLRHIEDQLEIIQALRGTQVRSLILSQNRLGDISPENFTKIIGAIQNTSIDTLDLEDNFQHYDLEGRLKIIESCKMLNLKSLKFGREILLHATVSSNLLLLKAYGDLPVDDEIWLPLMDKRFEAQNDLMGTVAFLSTTNIKALSLESSNFDPATTSTLVTIARLLKGSKIEHLNLKNCQFYNILSYELMRFFSYLQDGRLKSLDLSNNNLGEKHVKDLIPIFEAIRKTGVSELNLSMNRFEMLPTDTVIQIVKLLGSPFENVTLDLNEHSTFCRKFPTDIKNILKTLPLSNVTKLGLDKNGINPLPPRHKSEILELLAGTRVTELLLREELELDDELSARLDAILNENRSRQPIRASEAGVSGLGVFSSSSSSKSQCDLEPPSGKRVCSVPDR